jgi:uncharacterized protein YegL
MRASPVRFSKQPLPYETASNSRNGEEGVIFVLVAISLVAVIALFALPTNLLSNFSAREATQGAADAAALGVAYRVSGLNNTEQENLATAIVKENLRSEGLIGGLQGPVTLTKTSTTVTVSFNVSVPPLFPLPGIFKPTLLTTAAKALIGETSAKTPSAYIFVFDRSGSMKAKLSGKTPKISLIRNFLKQSVQKMLPGSELEGSALGIITFGTKAGVALNMVKPATQKQANNIKKKIGKITADGGTNLEAGVSLIDTVITQSKNLGYSIDNIRVIVLSDGAAKNGPVDLKQIGCNYKHESGNEARFIQILNVLQNLRKNKYPTLIVKSIFIGTKGVVATNQACNQISHTEYNPLDPFQSLKCKKGEAINGLVYHYLGAMMANDQVALYQDGGLNGYDTPDFPCIMSKEAMGEQFAPGVFFIATTESQLLDALDNSFNTTQDPPKLIE